MIGNGQSAGMITELGGFAVSLINATGAPTVKGYLAAASPSVDKAVELCQIDIPECFGVFLHSGVEVGARAWVVMAGLAEVYYSGAVNRDWLAASPLSTDSVPVTGQANAIPFPSPPFSTDKHFAEIGHVLQSIGSAGLAVTLLHFN